MNTSKTILLSLASGFLCLVGASAQTQRSQAAVKALTEDNTRAGNNTNSYEFRPVKDTKPPKGYKPFYISHYGRHGSRSNWGGKSYEYVISTLSAAKEAGILNAGGDSLLSEASRVLAGYDGMDGNLSQRGVREHTALAERMYERYPEVFKGDRKVRAAASIVQRCIVSMCAFTNELARENPKLDIIPFTGEKPMLYIDSTRGADKTTEGSNELLDSFNSKLPDDTLYVMTRLFTDPVKARALVSSPKALTDAIWDTAVIAEDFDIEENVFRFLPFDAIYKRWSRSNMGMYLHHCNSAEFGAKRIPLAKPCIDDIVAKADEAISTGEYAADLRFGHDNPLMAIVSYLGIEGVGDRLTYDQIDNNWLGFWNIPMASNLQIIFYKNKKGDVLVKFLYQEEEKLLRGLKPVSGPYYRWEDVKNNLEGYRR